MRAPQRATVALVVASAFAGGYVTWRVPVLLGMATTALALAVAFTRRAAT